MGQSNQDSESLGPEVQSSNAVRRDPASLQMLQALLDELERQVATQNDPEG